MGYINKNIIGFKDFILEEDGGTPVSNSGSAYINQGSVGGMGEVTNPTVSAIPGDPSGSESGSGDVSAIVPAFTFTKNTGITGNQYSKVGKVKLGKKFLQDAKKVKDNLGIGKVMSFQSFIDIK